MEKVILLKPYFSHTIWGGTKLRDEFGYDEPGDDIGECWGISAHPTGESVVSSGEYEGCKFSELCFITSFEVVLLQFLVGTVKRQ